MSAYYDVFLMAKNPLTIEFRMLPVEGELCQQEEDVFSNEGAVACKVSALYSEHPISRETLLSPCGITRSGRAYLEDPLHSLLWPSFPPN